LNAIPPGKRKWETPLYLCDKERIVSSPREAGNRKKKGSTGENFSIKSREIIRKIRPTKKDSALDVGQKYITEKSGGSASGKKGRKKGEKRNAKQKKRGRKTPGILGAANIGKGREEPWTIMIVAARAGKRQCPSGAWIKGS